MTSLQIRLLAVLKVRGPDAEGPLSRELIEENLVDDITTPAAIAEALDGLVKDGYAEEKREAWHLTEKGVAAAVEQLSW